MRKKNYIFLSFVFISFHISIHLGMASVKNKTVFCLLLLFIITNSIHGFYLYHQPTYIEAESNINDDLSSDHSFDLRSVLWPKICFTGLMKKSGHPNRHHITKRNTRKCYPFDDV